MQATTFLTGVTNKLAERWVVTLFTPAFVFWIGGGIVTLQAYGWKNYTRIFIDNVSETFQVISLLLFLLVIVISGFVIQRFDFATIRLLEGYWPRFLQPVTCWLIKRQKAKYLEQRTYWQALENKTTLTYQETRERADIDWLMSQRPRLPEHLMPTELGNVLRAAELAPTTSYGLDAVVCWPRLWMILPEQARTDISDARAELDTAARTWLWSALFCLWATAALSTKPFYEVLWPIPVGGLSACISYRWALSASKSYANLIRAAYDLYRFKLYEAMDLKIPETQGEEIQIAQRLNTFWLRGY